MKFYSKYSRIKILNPSFYKMFFFVRHGERSDRVPEEAVKIINKMDCHLTPEGFEQSKITGKFLREKFDSLVESGELDADYEVVLLSSPYIRCLKTARGIYEGMGKPIRQNKIFVESAIEEFNNIICEYDGTQKKKRLFNNYEQYKDILDPIFEGLEFEVNQVFNYDIDCFNTPWEESWEQARLRFKTLTNEIGAMFESGKENPRKTVLLMTTHGIFPESFYKHYFNEWPIVDYCAINHIKLNDKDDNGDYKIEVLLKNHAAWKN